jgi:hypothetical protein
VVSEVDDLGLGRLRRVANVRDIWSHEATAFTPWLSKHLDILGDERGARLTVVATEVPIGEFRRDIQTLDEHGRTEAEALHFLCRVGGWTRLAVDSRFLRHGIEPA